MKPALKDLTVGHLTETEALKAIKAKHFCQEHQRPCYVQIDGSHYQYIYGDLAKWAHLLVCLMSRYYSCAVLMTSAVE